MLIAMLHQLICGNTDISAEIFEVRTRKILSYSNVIASSSNLIITAIGVAAKNDRMIRSFDMGGIVGNNPSPDRRCSIYQQGKA